jgi:hypothetical protein
MSSDSETSSSGEIKSGYGPMFLILLGLGIVASILAGLAVHSIGDDRVHVYYRVSVARNCMQLDKDFQDIRLGKAVNVYNRKNQSLGAGKLEVQSAVNGKCEYAALFDIKLSRDRTYKISTGNKYRGELIFTDDDLVALQQGRTLVAFASLG